MTSDHVFATQAAGDAADRRLAEFVALAAKYKLTIAMP